MKTPLWRVSSVWGDSTSEMMDKGKKRDNVRNSDQDQVDVDAKVANPAELLEKVGAAVAKTSKII